MNKNLFTLVGALMAFAMIATACGGSDSAVAVTADEDATDAVTEEPVAADDDAADAATEEPVAADEDAADTVSEEPVAADEDASSPSSADQEVIDALLAQMQEGDPLPEGLDANCMATAMVQGMGGAAGMEENFGLTAEAIRNGQEPDDVELSRSDAIALADGVIGCDFADAMVSELAGDDLSEDDAKCLFENIDQDIFRDIVASGFMSDADAAAIEEAANTDIIPSMLAAFIECDIDPTLLGG